MLKYKDKKWYQFWQPEIQLSPTSARRKKNFPFLFYWFHFRKVNIKEMFITGYCSFLAQSCTVWPQSCGFNWGVFTHTQRGVCAVGQLRVDGLGARMVICYKWRNRGMLRRRGRDFSWVSPVLNFHMPKDSALSLSAIIVWPLWGRGNKSEVLKLKQLYLCHLLNYKRLSWTFPPFNWLVISIISEKDTNCLLPYL